MNTKKYVIASLVVFAFIFVFEWIFHGMLLHGIYEQTSHLWRPKGEYNFLAMTAGQLLFTFVFVFIFLKGLEHKGLAEGVRFGLLIGLLYLSNNLIFYAVQPLPANLIVIWSVGAFIELALAGVILAVLYRK